MTKDSRLKEINKVIKKRKEAERQGVYNLDDHKFTKWVGLLLVGGALIGAVLGG